MVMTMFKLNNRGWGYFPFLVILSLLLFLILFITFLANQYDRQFPNDGYRIKLVTKKNNLLN